MKRVTWLTLLLILCVILTLTACGKQKDPAEESMQATASEALLQTETELASDTVHWSDIDLDSNAADTTAVPTEPAEPPIEATELPVPDTTVPQSSEAQTEPAPTETEKTADPQPTEPKPTTPAPTEPKPTAPAPTEPKPTEPAPTQPKPTEPAPTQPKPTEPSQPPTEPTQPPTEPTQPPTEPTQPPTEPPTEPPKPAIDASALEAYGNQYAASLGFQIDYSMTTGNSGYFPPDSAILNSEEEGRSFVAGQVKATYDYLIAYLGNIEGARCRVLVTSNGGGRYTVTVLYG